MHIQEAYKPHVLAANASYTFAPGVQGMGGFLCTVSGTVSLTTASGTQILNAFAVSAGVYYPMPWYLGINGNAVFTCAGGAAGVLGIS